MLYKKDQPKDIMNYSIGLFDIAKKNWIHTKYLPSTIIDMGSESSTFSSMRPQIEDIFYTDDKEIITSKEKIAENAIKYLTDRDICIKRHHEKMKPSQLMTTLYNYAYQNHDIQYNLEWQACNGSSDYVARRCFRDWRVCDFDDDDESAENIIFDASKGCFSYKRNIGNISFDNIKKYMAKNYRRMLSIATLYSIKHSNQPLGFKQIMIER